MGKWVVTVAGIAILSILCDVILPDGQTRKYVKTVFGVVVSLVIIQPIVGLFSNGTVGVSAGQAVVPQEQYLSSVANRQSEYALRTVKQLLEAKGVTVRSIKLSSAGDRLELELAVHFTDELDTIVQQVARAYFPNAELVCIWGGV